MRRRSAETVIRPVGAPGKIRRRHGCAYPITISQSWGEATWTAADVWRETWWGVGFDRLQTPLAGRT